MILIRMENSKSDLSYRLLLYFLIHEKDVLGANRGSWSIMNLFFISLAFKLHMSCRYMSRLSVMK